MKKKKAKSKYAKVCMDCPFNERCGQTLPSAVVLACRKKAEWLQKNRRKK